MSITELKDFDNFFYYGDGDLAKENESDLYQIIVQNSRSLYYNRSNDTAGLDAYENTPNAVATAILLPYNIVSAVSKRNTHVGNGQNNTKDRRIIVSQNSVKSVAVGNLLDISVFYIALVNINEIQSVNLRIPVI